MMDPASFSSRVQNRNEPANTSSYQTWNNFFLLAGIPNSVAGQYAITFSQHRMSIDMLKEITKDILLDMGIKAMGDIIAILRHAKNLCTQDELKVDFVSKVSASTVTNNSINVGPKQTTTISNLAQRMPITTTRSVTNNSASLGNKIQSRVSLNSGALMSTNDNPTQIQPNIKRQSSTISPSLAKRLKPASDKSGGTGANSMQEKTLTVHYPSSSAIARAQQRISAKPNSLKQGEAKTASIKDRLGTVPVDKGQFRNNNRSMVTNDRNSISSRPNNSQRNRPHSSDTKPNRDAVKPDRLKSTVFHRLGSGPR